MSTTKHQPRVAIVGRPNVGKSSLFNRFIERRTALVHDQPGVTRDRIYGNVEWNRKAFEVIDTGGLEPGAAEPLKNLVERQVQFAIQEARVILFVVDGQQGILPMDRHIAGLLHKHGKPVVLAVNKVDNIHHQALAAEFYPLGFGDPIWMSAQHGSNVDMLLDELCRKIEEAPASEVGPVFAGPKVCFVGKPNAGKSTIINTLLQQERLLVHHEPGTTRDSIMVPFRYDEKDYTLVDTAGIRRNARIDSAVEKLSVVSSGKAIEQADIAVLMLDGPRGLDAQDKRVAGLIQDANKPCVVAINKWDAIEDGKDARKKWEEALSEELFFFNFCPHLYISGKTKRNLAGLMKAIDRVHANRNMHYPAQKLTAMVKEAAIIHQPPSHLGRKLNVYYVTQLKNQLATFIFKVNDPKLVHFSYKRYLTNLFRQTLGFEGIPLTLVFRDKGRGAAKEPPPAAPKRDKAPIKRTKRRRVKED
jgi:GTP-binding protein